MLRRSRLRDWLRIGPIAVCFALLVCGFALSIGTGEALAACPNEAFRSGASSRLPDCRAFELITPADSAGRNFFTIESSLPVDMFPTSLVTASGDSALFATNGRPLEAPGEPNGIEDVYQAQRKATGWEVVRLLTPSGAQAFEPNPGGISADHQYSFQAVTPLAGGGGTFAEEGPVSLLGNPDGSFELLGVGSLGVERAVLGRFISSGGEHIIFTTTAGHLCPIDCEVKQLEPDAPPSGTEAVYDRSADGPTRVVSLLPNDVTPGAGENAGYQGVSVDGRVVAFKVGATLYVRIDDSETKEVTGGEATYAGLSSDGSHLFYVKAGDVFVFDTATGQSQEIIATGDAELVNVSADGSHAYFISRTAVPGSGGGVAGEPNLYVYSRSSGLTRFIGTVAQADLEGEPALNRWTTDAVVSDPSFGKGPGADSSRTTPNGTVIAFESRAQLTSYENQGHVEIYRYDAGEEELSCVSCNPLGEPAVADARFEALASFKTQSGGQAMVIDNLSSDGRRVFFETPEGLTRQDEDGVNDIYEWQEEVTGRSLALISSGSSVFFTNPSVPLEFSEPNVLFAVTPSGSDVIFRTSDALVPAAGSGGAEGVYDARVGGGFAQPAPRCLGQACGEAGETATAPALTSPASRVFEGKGNVKPGRKKRCPRVRHPRRAHDQRRCHRHKSHPRHRKGA
jgi:Tol biopolymer transport system component